MAFMFTTRSPTILLLASFCWASTALGSEETEPSSVSEQPSPEVIDAVAPPVDPLPMLVHLAESGDDQGLRTEALKAQHDDPENPDVAYMAALGTWRVEGDPQVFLDVSEAWPGTQAAELGTLGAAEHWTLKAPRLGVRQYQTFISSYPDSAYTEYATIRAARGLAHDGYFGMALTQLDNGAVEVPDQLRSTLSATPDWKRPLLATALSGAVPGLGQLYAGQPQAAASAFVVNALFISGMAYAANQGQWTAFGVTAFFGLGFYMGNIYGAADACLRHNRGLRDDILTEMDTTWPADPPLPAVE